MKNKNSAYFNGAACAVLFLAAAAALLTGGCIQPTGEFHEQPAVLIVTITGSGTAVSGAATANRSYLAPALTVLAADPAFTGYELYVSSNSDGSGANTYSSNTGSFQIALTNGAYYIAAAGFTGDNPVARTWKLADREDTWTPVTISGDTVAVTLELYPYMYADVYGTLRYSLSWSDTGQIPARADLLVEQYDNKGTPTNFDDDTWNPISIALMNENVTTGAAQGMITLLRRETGLVQQSGALSLPPGEYRLTTTVAMDNPYPPVSRTDIAHVFSNLTTPAAFVYGSGDLIVTNTGTDTGSGFITAFNFKETPGATSIIGSNPSQDGTRLIMVTVPSGADLTRLTPVVKCAEGARITSPAPSYSDGNPFWSMGDYSKPTYWTATGWNGVTQQYTVVVTEAAADDCSIVDVAFEETGLMQPPDINQSAGTITVIVPNGTGAAYQNYNLTPVISWLGKDIKLLNADNTVSGWSPGQKVEFGSTPSRKFRVYAQSGTEKEYTITIAEAANADREITRFVIDGYPDCTATITNSGGNAAAETGTITVTLPYGVSLVNLKPLIQYKGKTLDPAAGVEQNFSAPKYYTVTAANGNKRIYTVTVNNKAASTDTGIFDFVIVNVPRAKVVIGTKPRTDGKIPIIVSVPYATTPLTQDESKTDLTKLIPKITLSNSSSVFINPNDANPSSASSINAPNGTSDVIPFGDQNDYQEAVYRIRAQDTSVWQDYVVIVARDVHYYYVSASGNDTDPDYYNGSEQAPFKTLANAVYQAVKHNVDHIYVVGTLNDSSEGGAWENTSATQLGQNGTFGASGAPSVAGGNSVFNINGAGKSGNAPWPIYITGVGSNAILQGTTGKRVISITGGAHITFENIAIQSGSTSTGNGGGLYVGGGSTVIWKSGAVSGNTAVSGGGVYVDNSEFQLLAGSVNGNTASGSAVTRSHFENNTISAASITGGGGVYLYGEVSLFWLAEGTISGNKTNGSGGGVLVNGSTIPDNPNPNKTDTPLNFMMTAGEIKSNTSSGGTWPHGGGGVYMAKGVFEMLDGHITNNTSTRQGGGVFVWSRSLFDMYGNSSVTGNNGTGSSKAIATRGITTMRGNAQADKVYVWNYSKGSWNNGSGDEFTMTAGARVTGLELAFADDPKDNRNYVRIVGSLTGSDLVTTIGLESHLTSTGSFATDATIAGDWVGKYLIKGAGSAVSRFAISNYINGLATTNLTRYKLDSDGKLVAK